MVFLRAPKANVIRILRGAIPVALCCACLGASPLVAQARPEAAEGTRRVRSPAALRVDFAHTGPLLSGMPVTLRIRVVDADGNPVKGFEGPVALEGAVAARKSTPVENAGPFVNGECTVEAVTVPGGEVVVAWTAPDGTTLTDAEERLVLPGFFVLLPPLVAIALALVTRQVLIALFCGVWIGAMLHHGLNPVTSLLRSLDQYLVGSLASRGHAFIILFSLTLAGMVGIITAVGGVRGVVAEISRLARTRRSGQLATWLMGVLIFFDDYANSLIVGNTMRPFTDRLRISREKLSFIVDSTAAPVATVGVISTWTAFQIGLIGDELPQDYGKSSYEFFLHSIPYAFYSVFMLFFVFWCALTMRDFGPMRKAEERCRATGEVLRPGAQPLVSQELEKLDEDSEVTPRWYNAAIPIACVVLFTIIGLFAAGLGGEWSAYEALLWAAAGATIVAAALAMREGWTLGRVIDTWVSGVRSLILAIIILVLAWAISAVCKDLHTGDYVAQLAGQRIPLGLYPVLTFASAALIAFSTGTSYGTMGILIPIILPLILTLTAGSEPAVALRLQLSCVAAVLGGAVFGDHCSPISDTTVLSSMASGADHIDHVRTQLPYALFVGGIAIPSYAAVGFGLTPWLVLPVGLAVLVVAHRAVTKRREPD